MKSSAVTAGPRQPGGCFAKVQNYQARSAARACVTRRAGAIGPTASLDRSRPGLGGPQTTTSGQRHPGLGPDAGVAAFQHR
jgi:hypothetical protein